MIEISITADAVLVHDGKGSSNRSIMIGVIDRTVVKVAEIEYSIDVMRYNRFGFDKVERAGQTQIRAKCLVNNDRFEELSTDFGSGMKFDMDVVSVIDKVKILSLINCFIMSVEVKGGSVDDMSLSSLEDQERETVARTELDSGSFNVVIESVKVSNLGTYWFETGSSLDSDHAVDRNIEEAMIRFEEMIEDMKIYIGWTSPGKGAS